MLTSLKDSLRSGLGVSPDALLVLLGLGCFLVTCLIAVRPLSWAWALVPGVCIAVILEGLEIRDHYGAQRLLDASAGDIAAIFWRHARDVLLMNLGPVLVVLVAFLVGRASVD